MKLYQLDIFQLGYTWVNGPYLNILRIDASIDNDIFLVNGSLFGICYDGEEKALNIEIAFVRFRVSLSFNIK